MAVRFLPLRRSGSAAPESALAGAGICVGDAALSDAAARRPLLVALAAREELCEHM